MTLLSISRLERDTSPVFIVGEARSGSTILYRVLQKHSAFRGPKENLQESKIMTSIDELASVLGPQQPKSMFRYMADERSYDEFRKSVAPIRSMLKIGEDVMRRLDSSSGKYRIWVATGHPLAVRSYFYHARQAHQVDRVLEKTPNAVMQVNRLRRCYPNAKFIYIHRHPVDVYASYVSLSKVDEKFRWARIPMSEFAYRWRVRSKCAIAFARKIPESFSLLSYEQFTSEPDETIKRLCEFLGEDFDPDMVVEEEPNKNYRMGAPHLYGEITTKTKEWQDHVTARQAAELQKKVRPVMRELAYPLY